MPLKLENFKKTTKKNSNGENEIIYTLETQYGKYRIVETIRRRDIYKNRWFGRGVRWVKTIDEKYIYYNGESKFDPIPNRTHNSVGGSWYGEANEIINELNKVENVAIEAANKGKKQRTILTTDNFMVSHAGDKTLYEYATQKAIFKIIVAPWENDTDVLLYELYVLDPNTNNVIHNVDDFESLDDVFGACADWIDYN